MMTNPGDGAQSPRPFTVLGASSLAARIAFTLAFVGGISWAWFAIKAVEKIRPDPSKFDYYPSSGTVVYPPSSTWAWWTIGVGCLAAALLVSGAAMIAMRRRVSRILMGIGCGVVTAYGAFSIVAALRTQSRPVHNALPLPLETSIVVVVFAAVTVVFVLAPSTRRWLESAQQGGHNSDAVGS